MKALPEALRQILRDLIEKKLWPVAVLLLAAIVVAPMLLGASSPDADPVSVAAAPSAALPVPAVAPAAAQKDAASAKRGRGGKVEDPFYDPPAAPQASSSVTAPAPDAGGAGSAPTADKTAPAAGGGAAKPSEQAVAKPPAGTTRAPAARARRSVYYRTVVRWGPERAASHPIARLTPLGGREDPVALYLGVTRFDALWAIFALGRNTTSKGDATCKTGTGCRMIGLRRGDKQIVTVRDTDGRMLRRFTLQVRSVRTITTSPARARTMRAKVHSDGRAAIGAMRQDPVGAAVLGQAAYRLRTGLLYATVPRDAVKKVTR
jgi:hypothetical protein